MPYIPRKQRSSFPAFAEAVREYFKEPATTFRLGVSRWYDFPEFRIRAYMRFQLQPAAFPLGTFLNLLVIANVETFTLRDRQRGNFNRFRESVESLAAEVGALPVVESVLNTFLRESLLRHGYSPRTMRDVSSESPDLALCRRQGC